MIDVILAHWIQLGIGLGLAFGLFVMGYVLPKKIIVWFLLLIIPFQFISSVYGTSNTAFAYLAFFAVAARGGLRKFPMAWYIGMIIVIYAISAAFAESVTYPDHFFYIVTVVSSFAVFYLAYNYAREGAASCRTLDVFVWMDALVIGYCCIQLVAAFSQFVPFGLAELAFRSNMAKNQRLVGPFGAPGPNAEFFVLQIFLMMYIWVGARAGKYKAVLVILMVANVAFLVATGNRGGFIVLVVGIPWMLWVMRRELGPRRILMVVLTGSLLFTGAALSVIRFTEFNVLFSRLEETKIENGVPDTRVAAWALAVKRIPEHPWLGHGPRLRLINESTRRIPGYIPLGYPHNLVLYLLYSVGLAGMIVYAIFYIVLLQRLHTAGKALRRHVEGHQKLLGTVSTVILVLFLVDQIKISYLRVTLGDMQQYLMALFGCLLGCLEGAATSGDLAEVAPR